MIRDAVFRSGVPLLIAATGLLSFGYIATIRRERLAVYWAVAWALLMARYGLIAVLGNLADPVADALAAALRVGFACAVLGGVLALSGREIARSSLVTVSVVLAGFGHAVRHLAHWFAFSAYWTLGTMLVLLLAAVVALWRADVLPTRERRFTAVALAGYAIASTTAPRMPDGSTAFMVAMSGTWAALLLLSIGLMAVFFRLAMESERVAAERVQHFLAAALGQFISVCMHCRAVRGPSGEWQPLEHFVTQRGSTALSHGLCASCADRHYDG